MPSFDDYYVNYNNIFLTNLLNRILSTLVVLNFRCQKKYPLIYFQKGPRRQV